MHYVLCLRCLMEGVCQWTGDGTKGLLGRKGVCCLRASFQTACGPGGFLAGPISVEDTRR